MKIYIHHNNVKVRDKRALFILTRPFYSNNKWTDDENEKQKWRIQPNCFHLAANIKEAQIVLIPFSINSYFSANKAVELNNLNTLCQELQIKAYGFIIDDFGIAFPDYSNIIYFRSNGFKSQLSECNKGFPVSLSDHFQLLYKQETITPNPKEALPNIGFCGHATLSFSKRIKELLIFGRENIKRIVKNPFRKDWEPFFASAFERAKLLKLLENSPLVKTNFIYRKQYRAGVKTILALDLTTKEYFDNIYTSDYVLCIRGAGNFSVRFYETLMFGRIPIFVNTDCLLPFEDTINWKNHVIWVEWSDRNEIAEIVSEFQNKMSNSEFENLQIANRKLWKETLSIQAMLELIN